MATVESSEATNDLQFVESVSGQTGAESTVGSEDLDMVEGFDFIGRTGPPTRTIVLGFPPAPPPVFYQRIFDNGLSQYVYYTLPSITTAPTPAQTTPNHSGDLDAASHAFIEER